MNEEIKEILNNADSNTKFKMVDEDGTEKEMNIAGLVEQLLNDNKQLLDYITNLQQANKNHSKKIIEMGNKITNLQEENERLKETNVYCNRTDCIGRIKDSRKYDSVYQEKEDYKSRIEKAIEYIEHENFKRNILVGVSTKKYTKDILNNVLNILQGDELNEE